MKIDRLVSIILVLLDKGRIGAQELANMFEVSLRTIYRDIDTINMSGIPVHSTSGVGGGFEIMQNYKIDKKVFSTADLSAILMGLSSLSNTMQGVELSHVLAKVKSFIPIEKTKEIELKANQIHIDLSPWSGNRNIQSCLEVIKTALQESRLITFQYSAHHGNQAIRIVEPYQLVLKNNHWYLQGYCHKRSNYRLFKLSRISNLQINDKFFIPRDYQKPILDISDILDTLQTKIEIRIHKAVLDRILDYCAYEDLIPDGEEYFIAYFPFIENDFYYDILLGLGNKCECLAPPHIRTEMMRKIYTMAVLYEN